MLTPRTRRRPRRSKLDPWWIMSHETTADKSSFGVSSGKPGGRATCHEETPTPTEHLQPLDIRPTSNPTKQKPLFQQRPSSQHIAPTTVFLLDTFTRFPALLHVMRVLTGSHGRRRRPLARRLHACVDISVQRREFQGLLLDLHAPTWPRRVWSCAVCGFRPSKSQ